MILLGVNMPGKISTEKELNLRIYVLLFVTGALLFLPNLGAVHLFDWDEINFAESAREMLVTGDYLTVRIDYKPFHEKPPLFIWVQALSMNLFGVNEYAARLPNAIIGIITLLVIYTIGRKIFNYRFGLLWVLAYIGSFLPHFYFKTGIIDPLFNLLIFSSIYWIYLHYEKVPETNKLSKYIIAASVFSGLAVLTKGPVGWGLVFISWIVYYLLNRKNLKFPYLNISIFTIIAFLPMAIWYGAVISQSGAYILNEFIDYHIRLLLEGEAGHSGPIYYHWIIILFGCFPASILMLRAFRRQEDLQAQADFKRWMFILFFVVMFVFSIVKTKIVHYSSLAYFPVTFLAAYAMFSIIYRNMRWKVSTTLILSIIGSVIAILLTLFPLALMNAEMLLPKIKDEFTKAVISSDVSWKGFEFLIGIFYLTGLALSIIFLYRRSYLKSFTFLFASTAFVIITFLPLVAPKIEQYTQVANIEFYSSLQDNDVYIEPLGYKSYAHYFYGRRRPENSTFGLNANEKQFEEFLLKGDIDKPAFFSVRIHQADKYLKYEGVEKIFRKNGFVFLRRLPEDK